MRVPFITKRSEDDHKKLYRRKGGGGGKGGGASGAGGSRGGSGGGGGRTGGRSSTPVSAAGSTRGATPYGNGGGPQVTIAQGLPFAGRFAGGGTRAQVFGNRQFGSGYPGVAGRGVAGRGFPFYFWPVAWGGLLGGGTAAYLHNSEYGRPDNSSRPGGPIVTAAFISNSTNTTFRVISDNTTVTELIGDVKSNCSSHLSDRSTTFPDSYNDSLASVPQPEQTVQYYRASSVALTLDGYNNTAALGPDDGTPDASLPSNIDTTLLDCLNQTIGQAVPLIDAAGHTWATPNVELVGMLGLLWWFLASIL